MAENTPKKAEDAGKSPSDASKVQPKKETVRINLPPKPTAAPTVKIPAPAPVIGARPAPSAPTTPASRTAVATQKLPAAPSAIPRRASVPSAPPRPAPSMAPRRASRHAPAISGFDKGLAITAVVVLAFVVAQMLWIGM